jgi:hypothetical protein
MKIVLNKVLNIVTAPQINQVDYYEINPFDLNGNLMPQMNVVVQPPIDWSGLYYYLFLLPNISILPTFDFQINFTTFFDESIANPYMLYVGSAEDIFSGLNTQYGIAQNNTMTCIPVAQNVTRTQGMWLINKQNPIVNLS